MILKCSPHFLGLKYRSLSQMSKVKPIKKGLQGNPLASRTVRWIDMFVYCLIYTFLFLILIMWKRGSHLLRSNKWILCIINYNVSFVADVWMCLISRADIYPILFYYYIKMSVPRSPVGIFQGFISTDQFNSTPDLSESINITKRSQVYRKHGDELDYFINRMESMFENRKHAHRKTSIAICWIL